MPSPSSPLTTTFCFSVFMTVFLFYVSGLRLCVLYVYIFKYTYILREYFYKFFLDTNILYLNPPPMI